MTDGPPSGNDVDPRFWTYQDGKLVPPPVESLPLSARYGPGRKRRRLKGHIWFGAIWTAVFAAVTWYLFTAADASGVLTLRGKLIFGVAPLVAGVVILVHGIRGE